MSNFIVKAGILCASLAVVALWSGAASADGEVNLYSARQPFLIDPLLKSFTEETGIKVNMVYIKKGMFQSFLILIIAWFHGSEWMI